MLQSLRILHHPQNPRCAPTPRAHAFPAQPLPKHQRPESTLRNGTNRVWLWNSAWIWENRVATPTFRVAPPTIHAPSPFREGRGQAGWAWPVRKGRGLARWAWPRSRCGRPWRPRERRSDHYTDKIKASWTGSKSAYVEPPCSLLHNIHKNVRQNSHHDQQHRPGPQDRAAAQDRGLHREDKGVQGLGRPHAVL